VRLSPNLEDIEKSLESTEDAAADGLHEDTYSGNQSSAEESNDLPEGSDVGELNDTDNEGPDPVVTCNRKRKKGDDETQSPDDKMDKKYKINKMTEQAVDEENDSSSSSPLNLPWNYGRLRSFNKCVFCLFDYDMVLSLLCFIMLAVQY